MKTATALELRQSLGRVIATLRRTGEPVLLKKGNKPVAVLISIEDYEQRFAEKEAGERRRRLLEEMDALARPSRHRKGGVELLRELRGGS